MNRTAFSIAALLALYAVHACAQPGASPPPAPALQPITVHITGGFAGLNQWVEVTPDGLVRTYDQAPRPGPPGAGTQPANERRGRLAAAEIAELARAFEGWSTLAARYAPDRPVADGMQTEIRYGAKAVVLETAAHPVPEPLTRANGALQRLVRQALDRGTRQGPSTGASLPAPLIFRRTGEPAGDYTLVFGPNGTASYSRLMRSGKLVTRMARLSSRERKGMLSLLADWGVWSASYGDVAPGEPSCAITYAGRTVTVGDNRDKVPLKLARLCDLLQAVARRIVPRAPVD